MNELMELVRALWEYWKFLLPVAVIGLVYTMRASR